MSSSTLDRMKASLFRSRPDSPSPRQSRRLSRILPSKNAKTDGSPTTTDQSTSVASPSQSPGFPLDPRPSPAASDVPFFAGATKGTEKNALPLNDVYSSSPDVTRRYRDSKANVYSDDPGLEEQDMNDRLMNMESSFIPDESTSRSTPARRTSVPLSNSSSAYVQSLTRSRLRTASSTRSPRTDSSPRDTSLMQARQRRQASSASPNTYTTPATRLRNNDRQASGAYDEDAVDYGDTTLATSSMAHSLSSPSAAAARRSQLRTEATHSSSRDTSRPTSYNQLRISQLEGGTAERTASPHSLRRTSSYRSMPEADIEGSLPLEEDTEQAQQAQPPSSLKPETAVRPSSTHRRQSSQRSTASSFLSNDASDLGAGAEYDIASGVATPRSASTLRPENELSRLPSLGSVASSLSARTDRSPARRQRKAEAAVPAEEQDNTLETLPEERDKTQSPDSTPRNAHTTDLDPTQTAVARHVRDVEVPATVARRFKATEISFTPKSNASSSMFGRAKNELSLKEQNSRIDKLSKENFDLKLKIHYLYQALQDRSDEGVKELISKNAELQTSIVKMRKENQAMRKRVRELERDIRQRDDGSSAVRTNADESEDALSSRSFRQAQLEDEVVYLRDRMQSLEEDNERLRLHDARKKLDSRNGATVGEASHERSLKAELSLERSKRETADQELQTLRLEVSRLKETRSPFKNLLMRRSDSKGKSQSKSPSRAAMSNAQESATLSGTTLVEQLKCENSDLRRDLGAQTSMLTSRNRERERLQQEIEDLKLVQRRGDFSHGQARSVSGDSILERSVSRAQARPASRASAAFSQISDADRDRLEAREGRLRDENTALKMRNQDLQGDLDMLTDSAEHLESLRNERDDALRVMEAERDWAADTIDRLEEAVENRDKDISRLMADLRAREEDSKALEVEIKEISASFRRVADASESSQSRIQDLEQDVLSATGELEATEQNLKDAQAAKERLEVQAESSQGEISFLREEQEADKIKISDLQSALNRAKASLKDEKERLREFEELEAEARSARDEARRLRKQLTTKDEEASAHRESLDELDSGLRKALGDVESNRSGLVAQVKRLQRELETSLYDLGQAKATHEHKDRQLQEHGALLEAQSVQTNQIAKQLDKERQARKLDRAELERARRQSPNDSSRVSELERARAADEEQMASFQQHYELQIRQHNKLLYSLWTRLAALCGAEWVSQFQDNHNQPVPTFEAISTDPTRINEPLLLALEAISHNMSTYRTRIRATEKDLARDLSAMSQSLDSRTQRLEVLEQELNAQQGGSAVAANSTTSTAAVPPADIARFKEENRLLRREIKVLKQANFALPGLPSPQRDLERTGMTIAALEREREALGTRGDGQTHARDKRPSSKRTNTTPSIRSSVDDGNRALQRHRSTNDVANSTGDGSASENGTSVKGNGDRNGRLVNGDSSSSNLSISTSDQTWYLRLKELERRLIAEREERLLDREGARQRLEEGRGVIEGLRKKLEREREKGKANAGAAGKPRKDKASENGLDGDEDDRDQARREAALDSRGRGRTRGGGPEEIV